MQRLSLHLRDLCVKQLMATLSCRQPLRLHSFLHISVLGAAWARASASELPPDLCSARPDNPASPPSRYANPLLPSYSIPSPPSIFSISLAITLHTVNLQLAPKYARRANTTSFPNLKKVSAIPHQCHPNSQKTISSISSSGLDSFSLSPGKKHLPSITRHR